MILALRFAELVLIAGLVLAAMAPAPAFGQDVDAASGSGDACDAPIVSESKAKSITHEHFINLGYTPPFGSTNTYRVGSAVCEGEIWRIRVRVGDDSQVPNRTVFMLVNCHTGALTLEAT